MATPVATSIPSNAASPSTEPRKLDDLDTRRSIYAGRSRLRALWTEWSVEVRVLSGALGKPRSAGFFMLQRRHCFRPGDGRTVATVGAVLNCRVPQTRSPVASPMYRHLIWGMWPRARGNMVQRCEMGTCHHRGGSACGVRGVAPADQHVVHAGD